MDLINYFALIQNPIETLHPLTHSSGKTQFLRHLHTKIVLLEFDLIESFYQDLGLKVFGKFTTLRSLCARKFIYFLGF